MAHASSSSSPRRTDKEREESVKQSPSSAKQPQAPNMSNGGSGSHSSSPSVQAASQPQHQPPASLTLLNPFLPIRRLVSGSRSRFYDPHLSLDLDLTYLTDQLILTSFPAPSSSSPSSALKGVQGLYRNRSEDVARFLASRHERGTWRVYNLVPAGVHPSSSSSSTSSTPARQNPQAYIKGGGRKGEASYAAAPTFGAWGAGGEADGVSRYPFPDHHPPPLSLIPLMVADLTSWLQGGRSETRVRYVPGEEKFDAAATSPTCGGADPDPDVGAEGAAGHSTKPDLSKKQAQRVAVIHCKAGKGRTGTMAICYLLTQAEMPAPPRDPRNHSGYRPPLPQPAPGPNSAAGAGVSGKTARRRTAVRRCARRRASAGSGRSSGARARARSRKESRRSPTKRGRAETAPICKLVRSSITERAPYPGPAMHRPPRPRSPAARSSRAIRSPPRRSISSRVRISASRRRTAAGHRLPLRPPTLHSSTRRIGSSACSPHAIARPATSPTAARTPRQQARAAHTMGAARARRPARSCARP